MEYCEIGNRISVPAENAVSVEQHHDTMTDNTLPFPQIKPPTGRLKDEDLLGAFERFVEIGDSISSGIVLRRFENRLMSSGEPIQKRLSEMKAKFEELLSHEAVHGRLSLLQWDSREVRGRQELDRLEGRRSRYKSD